MLRRTLAVVAVALAYLASVSCSSSGQVNAAGSGLAVAMDSVSGTGPAAEYFEYGDLAALRRLGVIHPAAATGRSGIPFDPRWARIAGVGASGLAALTFVLTRDTGLSMLGADTAVTIGQPPNSATRFDGSMDAKSISAKLTSFGAQPRKFGDTDGLSFGPDNQINLHNGLTKKLQVPIPELNEMVVTGDSFAASQNSATLQKVRDPGARSLLNSAHFANVAGCLGDVVAAIVVAPRHDSRAALVGVGVRTPRSAAEAASEVLCVLPSAGNQHNVHQSVAQRLATTATDPIGGSPVSQYVTKTAIDDTGDLVRAVLTDRVQAMPGYLIAGLSQNLAGYWDGSCTATDLAHRGC
jgi:hypothetical protein